MVYTEKEEQSKFVIVLSSKSSDEILSDSDSDSGFSEKYSIHINIGDMLDTLYGTPGKRVYSSDLLLELESMNISREWTESVI
jgi:hypothetical protein